MVLRLQTLFLICWMCNQTFAQPCQTVEEVVLRDSIGIDNSTTQGNVPFANFRVGSPSPWYQIPSYVSPLNQIKLVSFRAVGAQLAYFPPSFSNYDYVFRLWSSQAAFDANPLIGNVANIEFDTPSAGPTLFGTSGWVEGVGPVPTWLLAFNLWPASISIPANATYIAILEVRLSNDEDGPWGWMESIESGPSDAVCSNSLPPPNCYIISNSQYSTHDGRVAISIIGRRLVTLGDMNDDDLLNNSDISNFTAALTAPETFEIAFPNIPLLRGDMNCDGSLNGVDVQGFVDSLLAP